ncbi:hypothetical protein QM276_17695, partial [Acinetobacter baumannii]|uniref:hypothetical protein n=1 Tax=Acinetobacter baumannii TaxID=470 RepID=UPI0024B857F5
RKPDDHSADAFEKVAEAVYLANDPILTSNFDRMYRIVHDLKFLARSMERNEKEGHSAHGLLFLISKPSLFDDEVTPDHKTGALLRLD